MSVYIVKREDSEDMKIMTVKPEDEAQFLEDYAGKILIKGDSIQEALIRYGESLK